jgi:transposase
LARKLIGEKLGRGGMRRRRKKRREERRKEMFKVNVE